MKFSASEILRQATRIGVQAEGCRNDCYKIITALNNISSRVQSQDGRLHTSLQEHANEYIYTYNQIIDNFKILEELMKKYSYDTMKNEEIAAQNIRANSTQVIKDKDGNIVKLSGTAAGNNVNVSGTAAEPTSNVSGTTARGTNVGGTTAQSK